MAHNGVSINVHDHGVTIDPKKKRVKCNYCGKPVSGYSRLKCHLGGIRGDVKPCNSVPPDVYEAMRNDVLNKKKGHLTNEVGDNVVDQRQLETLQQSGPAAIKRRRTAQKPKASGSGALFCPTRPGFGSQPNGLEPVSRPNEPEKLFQECVGRFFFETATNFLLAEHSSFGTMMRAALPRWQDVYKIPTPSELEGWILQDAYKEVMNYVNGMRNSWPTTGCSILLDGWTDKNGRQLVSIIVDCPKGSVYFCSRDISAQVGDVDPLESVLEKVLEDVGPDNVVQIVAYSTSTGSTRMENVQNRILEKHRKLFWTVSASHCIELMLEEFCKMEIIKTVMENAKTITKFVHGSLEVLNFLNSLGCGQRGLVKPSRYQYAIPFLTLENIVSHKKNLKKMVESVDWDNSTSSSLVDARKVERVIKDESFWTGAIMALKASTPLVRLLESINEGGSENHRLGHIYEAMEQVNETIQYEFEDEESKYLPFWEIIVFIWNNHLHSPLHAAGYFLNPTLFYSENFLLDDEVKKGRSYCISHMAKNQDVKELIKRQVDDYEKKNGGFGQGCSSDCLSSARPETWWSDYASEFPELQKLAIRILSQTCNGGSRFGLKRELVEIMLAQESNPEDIWRLGGLTWVHYNLHLQNFEARRHKGILADKIMGMDDWVGKRQALSVDEQLSIFNLRSGAYGAGPFDFM